MLKHRLHDDRGRRSDRFDLLRMLQLCAAVLLFTTMGMSQATAQSAVITASTPTPTAGSGTVTYGASVAITDPALNSEQQITNRAYAWSSSDTCTPISGSPSTTVTANRSTPGPTSSSVSCVVTWTIYNTSTKITTYQSATAPSVTVYYALGVLWSPGTITGVFMTSPQNQTTSPYVPTVVVTSSGAQLTCTVSSATATDTSTFTYSSGGTLHTTTGTGIDTVAYQWTATAGTLANATSASATWTAPTTPQTSPVALTCTITATAPAVVAPDGGTRGPGSTMVTAQIYVPTLTVTGSQSWSPQTAYVGDVISCSASASVTPSVPGATDNVVWQTNKTYSSADGSDPLNVFNGSEAYVYTQGSLSSAFTAAFFSPGYYMIGVQATDTLKDSSGNTLINLTGNGYVGGSAADLSGGSSPQAEAVGAHAVSAQASGTGTHILVGGLSVTDSCSLGTTYYKGPNAVKTANASSPLAEVDTLDVDPGSSDGIDFSAQVHGNWPSGSQYNWACGPGALSESDDSEVYTTGNQSFTTSIPDQTYYNYSGAKASDQVRLNATPAGIPGPAIQLATTVNLHDPWEYAGPAPGTSSVTDNIYVKLPSGTWSFGNDQAAGGPSQTCYWTFTVTGTLSGTFKFTGGFTTKWLSLVEGTIGVQVAATATSTISIALPPGKRTFPIIQESYNILNGLFDNYNLNGYVGEYTQTYDKNWVLTQTFTPIQDYDDLTPPYPDNTGLVQNYLATVNN